METYQALWHSVAWFWKHGWDRNRLAHRYCWSHEGLTKCCGVWSVWWRDFGWNKWSVAKESRYNKVQQGTTRCSQLGIWPYIAVVNQKANGLEGCGLGFMFAQCWTRSMLFQWRSSLSGYVWLQCHAVLVLMAILICNPPWVGLCPWWTW